MTEDREKKSWHPRPARKEEIGTLSRIYNEVYEKDEENKYLEWKYLANPHGEAIIWVAESDTGEIVGSLAFMPRRMRIRGDEYDTYHGADAMVDSGWQRQGIMIALFNNMYDQCWSLGAPVAHMFPNRRSLGVLHKLSMHPVSLVQELELSLRGAHLFRRALYRLPFAEGLLGPAGDFMLRKGRLKPFFRHPFTTQITPIERFDDGLAEVAKEALKPQPVYMVRDRDWLNWRFLDNPTRRHRCFAAHRDSEPVGYLVMETGGDKAFLSDLQALDEAAREDLLATAIQKAHKAGAHMLQSMALEGDGVTKFLRRMGFDALPEHRLMPFMIQIGPEGEALREALTDSSAWYLAHGDRDVEHMTP
ncbi:MAG: GNAT family N-acetyltransferase [Planctomycetota bacterium]